MTKKKATGRVSGTAKMSKKKPSKKKTSKKKVSRKKASKKKASSKGRSKAGSGRRQKSSVRKPILRSVFALLVILGLGLGGYSLYLGKQVRVAFEGKRWAVPARVYARPLELYEGALLSPQQLEWELGLLGYRQVQQVQAPGQWARSGTRYQIANRPFRFWDGEQTKPLLQLQLAAGSVVALSDNHGQAQDLARLQPAEIGSIYPAHREDRVLVRRQDLPEHLVQALLAAEDRRFFEHAGVDPRGIARAMWANLRAGGVVQGGSTLTQQLVKNFILSDERSLSRKLNEALMALIVESRYSKDEILEAYANEIYLGQDRERAIHGFGLGALFYFNRPLQELRLHETALLVGLVKGASFYNPRRHPKRAKQRRDTVLGQMQAMGFIDAATAASAKAKPLGVSVRGKLQQHRYPAFIQLVRQQLRRDYEDEDLTSEGLRIFSTLDPWAQHQAERAVGRQIKAIEKRQHIKGLQAALVMASPQSGEVLALVGGRGKGGYNRALAARRPVGSLLKPAVYLTALAQPQRYTLASMLDDAPVSVDLPNGDRWQPRNFDRKSHGQVMLHRALARSLNQATVHLGLDLGLKPVIETLHRLGITQEIPAYPSLLLGAVPLSPLEVTQLYQTLAAGGFHAPLRAIREVLDQQQEPLQRYPIQVEQRLDPAATFLLTANLQEVVSDGTARVLQQFLPEDVAVAGKTGTTNDLRDSWFAGFSGDRVAAVWVGFDDNKATGLTGSSGAARIFGDAFAHLPSRSIVQSPPQGVEYHWVDAKSGQLSAEGCEGAMALPFIAGSQPKLRTPCASSQGAGFWQRLFD